MMFFKIFVSLLLFIFVSVQVESQQIPIAEHYRLIVREIANDKAEFVQKYKRAKTETEREKVLKEAQELFKSGFHILFLFWQGTPWTFNGNSEVPQKGSVACGPFIERMMRGLGAKYPSKIRCYAPIYNGRLVNIWQALSSEQVKAYCPRYIVRRSLTYEQKIKLFYKELGANNFYILGLADHIGFAGPSMPDVKDSLTFFDSLIWVKQEPLSRVLRYPRTEVLWIGIIDVKQWLLGGKS